MNLAHRKCIPCSGKVGALSEEKIKELVKQIDTGWTVDEEGHLNRHFTFPNFRQAMGFALKVGEVAEQENHHPELVVGWGKCDVMIWTHKINALTESDFILAAKIDAIDEVF